MKSKALATLTTILLLSLANGACRSMAPTTATPESSQPTPSTAEKDETYSNTVKWSTASEVDNFGYDVYRGESPDGPFDRLTKEPVEGAGTSDEVNRYRFVDDTIDPTKIYYYYVESISMSGVREHFTPIAKVKAKIGPASE